MTHKFALVITFFCLYLLSVSYLGGRWMDYSLFDYFTRFFQLIGSIIARPLMFLGQLRREKSDREQVPGSAPSGEFLRGLLITIPVVLGFSCLLSFAEPEFQNLLKDFPKFLWERVTEIIPHLPRILLMAYTLTGVFLHAGTQSRDEGQPTRPRSLPFLGFSGAAAVLLGTLMLFFIYTIFQIPYLSGKGPLDLPYGYPILLVIVVILYLILIYWLRTVTIKEDGWHRWVYSTLNLYIFIVISVILFAMNQRLPALMATSDPDQLLLARGSLVWLSLAYLIFVVLEAARLERDFAFTVVWVSIVLAFFFFVFQASKVIGKIFTPREAGDMLQLLAVLLKS